ncbi:MAG: alpha/beta hydrolase [Alphaproteobacteria bacterium]|nr:alpha/beta hydrolase [Alphaproteobacteria bacterium]
MAFIVVVGLGAVAASCSPSRVIEAARLMQDVAAGDGPSTLKEITPKPERRSLGHRLGQQLYEADIYVPADRIAGTIVLVPGVSPKGRDDERLVAFATSLARAHFVVRVPELSGLRQLRVSPGDTQVIADMLRLASTRDEEPSSSDKSVGLVAFSYAAGPALLAALEPDVGPVLDFVLLVGGYHSVEALATFVTTGAYRNAPTLPWQQATPNPRGKWLFLLSNADRVESATDRRLLQEIGERKFDDPEADIADLTGQLGPEGRAIDAFLSNTDPERVPDLIRGLPPSIQADMAALDPARRDLGTFRPRLYLVHGKDDAVIPFTESEVLSTAVPDATYFRVDSLAHVDLGPSSWFDAVRLWRAAYLLLGERED